MNVDLRTPSPADLLEYNENAERPYFIADSCLLDGGAVELEIGGVTIAGIFHPEDAYELALGVLDMETPERPRISDSVEWQEATLSEDELEWQAWSALTALHNLRSGYTPPTAPFSPPASNCCLQAPFAPQNATQGRTTYLQPVGLLTAEEIEQSKLGEGTCAA